MKAGLNPVRAKGSYAGSGFMQNYNYGVLCNSEDLPQSIYGRTLIRCSQGK